MRKSDTMLLHPFDAFLDVIQDFLVFRLLLRRELFAFVAQGKKAGGGEVQRVVDFVDDARAHAAQRREFFGSAPIATPFP